MKKDQVVILEKRGVVLVSGEDAKDFLQNIITNDINKVSNKNSVFSALLTPQGKYLNEFFIVQKKDGAHHLDGNYTIFGTVINGMEVVDIIANLPTDERDWPLNNVYINRVEIVN